MTTPTAPLPVYQPAHPAFADVVRASFARQGLMQSLGARLAVVEPGRVEIECAASDRVGQQQGYFHGGVLGAIGDSAGGYAALTLMPAGSEVVTIEYKINFLRPAAGSMLRAVGRVLRPGRAVTVAQVEIEALADGKAVLCGLMQATYARVELPAAG